MLQPLTHVLCKIFVQGFYRAHAGMFLFFFLVLIGAVDPGQLLNYHKTLMLAFITSPLMLLVVFGIWLLYTLKTWHYVTGQITAPMQQFVYYSVNAFSPVRQFKSWFVVQAGVLLPIIAYGITAVIISFLYGYYLAPVLIVLYLATLCAVSALLYKHTLSRLADSGSSMWFLSIVNRLKKPFFSLYVYHVLHRLKVPYVVTKAITWLVITAIFYLFADVKHDQRVAGMAVLAIAIAHAFIIFEERRFEEVYLKFARNMPHSHLERFSTVLLAYILLFLPEGVWLFSRFAPLAAVQLLLMGIGVVMLLHNLLYYLGLRMDTYLIWLMGLFVVLFWVMMFKWLPYIGAGTLCCAYLLQVLFYYRTAQSISEAS